MQSSSVRQGRIYGILIRVRAFSLWVCVHFCLIRFSSYFRVHNEISRCKTPRRSRMCKLPNRSGKKQSYKRKAKEKIEIENCVRLVDLVSWGIYCSYLPASFDVAKWHLFSGTRCAMWIISTNLVLNIEKSLSIWLYVFQLFVIASQHRHHCCFNKLNEIVIRLESRCSASDRISHRCRAITSNLSYFCLNVSNA